MRSAANFVSELRRRRVFKSALIYAITAWVVIQVAATVTPLLSLPGWVPTLVLVLAILGLPLMLVMSWVYDATPAGLVSTPGEAKRAAEPKAAPRSIAVLPFVDMSAQHDQEYFSDGIAEEILNVLAKLPHLRVAARTSAFAFKGKSEDVRRIGEQLGVGTVLEGSVRLAGNRIRITAQLISVADGYHLWSERYDREMGDVFAIQDEIAQNIVRALDLAIGGEAKLETQSTTSDIKAYDFYLRGRHYMQQLGRQTLAQAREMFLQAAACDPEYAVAYAGAAEASAMLYLYAEATASNLKAAEEYAERALSLAPDLAQVHAVRGHVLSLQKDYENAARQFEAALKLDPVSFDAHYYYARSRWAAGDLATAEPHFKRAAEVRPEDYQSLSLLASIYVGQGRKEEEIATLRAAYERVQRHLALNPNDVRALYMGAGALSRLGQEERAIEWADRAIAIDPKDAGTWYNVACLYARLGKTNQALDRLCKAVELGFAHREWMTHDNDLVSLRDDARFQALLDGMPS